MAKLRDYANAENLGEALKKEGLDALPHRVEPSKGTRVKPVFLLTIGTPEHDDIVTRLSAEGFAWEATEPVTGEKIAPVLPEAVAAEIEAAEAAETDKPPANGAAPGPDDDQSGEMADAGRPSGEDRKTFVVPEWHVAIKDPEGKATGEVRPMTIGEVLAAADEAELRAAALEVLKPEVEELPDVFAGQDIKTGDLVRVTVDGATLKVLSVTKVDESAPAEETLSEDETGHIAAFLGGRDPKDLPRIPNAHLSDLFFNYDVDSVDPEVVRGRAETFAASVLGAFGVAVDPDELVSDFFARL